MESGAEKPDDRPAVIDDVDRIARMDRNQKIRSHRRDFFGRIANETKRSDICDEKMEVVDWYAGIRKERTKIPNVIITSGDYKSRLQLSYAFYARLMGGMFHGDIDCDKAAWIILDDKRNDLSVRLFHSKILFIFDTEQFQDRQTLLDTIVTERYQKGNATIFTGQFVPVTETSKSLLLSCYTKFDLTNEEITHEHGCVDNPFGS